MQSLKKRGDNVARCQGTSSKSLKARQAFMILFLNKSVADRVSGVVSYRPEFNETE